MLTLEQLRDDLAAAVQAQAIAARAAEDADGEAAGKSGWGKELWLEERDEQEARAQEAGLLARDLAYQLEAYRQGRADALRGFEPDMDPRDVRPQDRDAIAYLAGHAAGLASLALLTTA